MGQKINPISLRLEHLNRSFDSSWYSKYYYSNLFQQDLQLKFYINSLLKQIQYPSARIFIQRFQKKSRIFVFFCSPLQSRTIRSKLFQLKKYNQVKKKKNFVKNQSSLLSLKKYENFLQDTSKIYKIFFFRYFLFLYFLFQKNSYSNQDFQKKRVKSEKLHTLLVRKKIHALQNCLVKKSSLDSFKNLKIDSSNNFSTRKGLDISLDTSTKLVVGQNFLSLQESSFFQNFYRKHMETLLARKLGTFVSIYPIKTSNQFQSALFLAEEIVYYIERRVSFRKIKNRILKEVSSFSHIKGIRITCSGRLGGRSKKAQRAKSEYFKYGQTSLHVFSASIDFASRTAHTPFGSVGIKVWICFQ